MIAAMDADGGKFLETNQPVKAFLDYLQDQTKSNEHITVWFHNLQYDLGNLFADKLDCLDITMVGGRLISARWGKQIVFRDSFNLWPMPLAGLGKAFGIGKLDMDVNDPAYVMRDVEILHAAMGEMYKLADSQGVSLPGTLGGLCVKVWRAQQGGNWPCDDEFAHGALYGGRTELFCPGGEGRILYCDINSLYPSVMLKPFPAECTYEKDIMPYGIADVTIEIPRDEFIAPLPMRRDDGSIYYPVGTFRGTWTTHEIRNAEYHGAKIMKVHTSFGTDEADTYYADFVRGFYDKRLAAKSDAEKLMFKLLMNNLYGQLGMKGEITRSLALADADHRGIPGIAYGTKKLAKQQIPLPEHVNYIHAAYITSYGRLRLQQFLRLIEPMNLIYCDTDSIFFFHDSDDPPFSISTDIGQMKLETIASRVEVLAPKTYRIDQKTKAKGVPSRYQEKFYDDGEVDFFSPYRLREAIAYFDRDNSKPLAVWRKVKKTLRSQYDKKQLKKNHWYPLTITN